MSAIEMAQHERAPTNGPTFGLELVADGLKRHVLVRERGRDEHLPPLPPHAAIAVQRELGVRLGVGVAQIVEFPRVASARWHVRGHRRLESSWNSESKIGWTLL